MFYFWDFLLSIILDLFEVFLGFIDFELKILLGFILDLVLALCIVIVLIIEIYCIFIEYRVFLIAILILFSFLILEQSRLTWFMLFRSFLNSRDTCETWPVLRRNENFAFRLLGLIRIEFICNNLGFVFFKLGLKQSSSKLVLYFVWAHVRCLGVSKFWS